MRMLLTDGRVIENCEELISDFYEKDAHGLYDRLEVPQNNELDLVSLASLAFFERQNPELAHWRALENRRLVIGKKLAVIPTTVAITDKNIPWNELTELFGEFLAVDGFSCARVTKILHKKRPRLIPILDRARVIDKYYQAVVEEIIERMHSISGESLSSLRQDILNFSLTATALVARIRDDILVNKKVLNKIKDKLDKEGLSLSLVRIFDIILWENAGRQNSE